jgi:hypothetical protein
LEEGIEPGVAEAFPRVDGVLHCEGVPLPELVARWGTPLYVYSRGAIESRYRELDAALAPVPHLIAYSVKANGNLGVLRTLAAMGAGADIVSGGELHRALLAGIPAERIVFSGVGKTVHELAAALRAGIYAFNVESEGELCALSDLACAMGTRAAIALRVNPDVETPHAARVHPDRARRHQVRHRRRARARPVLHRRQDAGDPRARHRRAHRLADPGGGALPRGAPVRAGPGARPAPGRRGAGVPGPGRRAGDQLRGEPRMRAAEWAAEIVPAIAGRG